MILSSSVIITTSVRRINYLMCGLWSQDSFPIEVMEYLVQISYNRSEKELVNAMLVEMGKQRL